MLLQPLRLRLVLHVCFAVCTQRILSFLYIVLKLNLFGVPSFPDSSIFLFQGMFSLSRLNFTFFYFYLQFYVSSVAVVLFFRSVENIFQSYEVLTIVICILFLHSSSLLLIINKFPIDELIICSLNVRGLSNNLKRRETFRWLRMKKFGIFFLQEVHCTKEKERLWSSEWGFSAIFSSVCSSSAGVCILFSNNFQFEIQKQFSDLDGRFILVDLKLENKSIRDLSEISRGGGGGGNFKFGFGN